MAMLKKIIGILLTMILIVSLLPLSAFAGGENGLVYHLTTDKSKYSKTEDITVTLTVTNKSSDGVSYAGVKLVNKVPAGYTLKKGSSLEKSVPVLAPGESAKLVSVFQPVYYPPTGDPGIGLTLLAGVIAVLCGLFLLSGKKGRYMNIFRSMMCLMMVLSLVTMILPQTAQAEPGTIPVSVTVKVEGDEIKISSYITYEDTLPLTSSVFALDDGNGSAAVTADGKAVTVADAGTSLAFKADPKDGYEFDYWEVADGGIDIGSVKNNASITVTMPGTVLALRAHFKAIAPETYAVTAAADENGTAAVTADGTAVSTAEEGTSLAFKAVPMDGYEFDYWEVVSGGIDIGSVRNNASITVTMPAAALSLKAHFKAIPPVTYAVTVTADENGAAAVRADGEEITAAAAGKDIVFSAVPDDYYEFDYWEVVSGGIDIGSVKNNASITVTMPAAALSLKVHFKEGIGPYSSISAYPYGHGTAKVTANGEEIDIAGANMSVTFSAVPDDGNEFDYWEVAYGDLDIEAIKNNATITVKMTRGVLSLNAHFKVKTYAITLEDDGHGTAKAQVNSADADAAEAGAAVQLIATPDSGYQFKEWSVVSGTITITDDKFTMPAEDVSVQAVFEKQVTVANVLSMASTTFPVTTDDTVAADGSWEATGDGKVMQCYLSLAGDTLRFKNVDEYENISTSAVVSKNGDNYVYTGRVGTVTFTMSGEVLESITFAGAQKDTWDGTYKAPACIAAGTMISMPDGKQKAVEELEIGDVICTFDHETGKVSSAPVVFVWETPNAGNAFTLTFEDGTAVTVIQEHGFFDQEEQQYAFINLQNAEEYIGHHFYNADSNSWLELKSCEVLNHSVDAYDIVTSGDFNHMANGLLAIGDGTEKMFANLFAFDDQMKFDADQKKADIETYGLTPREKVLELEGFTESEYDTYNLQYLDILIGKGIVTWEQMEALSDYCVENGF